MVNQSFNDEALVNILTYSYYLNGQAVFNDKSSVFYSIELRNKNNLLIGNILIKADASKFDKLALSKVISKSNIKMYMDK